LIKEGLPFFQPKWRYRSATTGLCRLEQRFT